MPADPDIFLSFAAGLLSFFSPCVLPLIPSFISYIGGVSLSDLREEAAPKKQIFLRTLLFVLGFSFVFIFLGVLFSGSGFLFSGASGTISLIAGVIVILLGLNVIFDFAKFLNFEKKIHISRVPRGYLGSFFIGMAFGGGWTPCVGPILAGILFLAGQSGQITTGILYLFAYSLGLGIPFLLAGVFFTQFMKQLGRMKKYLTPIRIGSGIFLILIGLLIAFGRFQQLNITLISWGYAVQEWSTRSPQLARIVLGSISIGIGLLAFLPGLLRRGRSKGSSDDGMHRRVISLPGGIFFSVFFLLGILQYTGVVNMAEIITGWLTFQGI